MLLASALVLGSVPLLPAQSASQPGLFDRGISAGSDVLTVREASEGPRREDRKSDRRNDRQNDRRSDRRSADATPTQFNAADVILVREGASGGGRHRQRRGGTP
ncbi:MAG: hypothetical protein AB7F35_01565 [Acetobacteraceae bacterium]